MLTLFSLLLVSPLRCSTLQALLDSNSLIPPQSPRQSPNRNLANQPIVVNADSCKGILPYTCTCQPDVDDRIDGRGTLPVESLSCQNSRFTDTDVLKVLITFPNLEYATFYGNNFVEFADRILVSGKHKSLSYLNLSNNNLLYLNQDAFLGMPSLQSLDLSENALYLRDGQGHSGDSSFLRPLRFLRRLLLRKAFRRPLVNATWQLSLLERGLKQARLNDLEFLDLSENDFDTFPSNLVCSTPALTHLILASNRLRTLHFDKRCPIELKALDVRWNRFKYFDHAFTRSAKYFGPISVQAADNPFDCRSLTCESYQSIVWFRSTTVVKDKETIRCQSMDSAPDPDSPPDSSSDYKPDNYLLYAPLKPRLQCPDKESSASQERNTASSDFLPDEKPTLKPKQDVPKNDDDVDENDSAVTLLNLDSFDNETFANNSASTLKPFSFLMTFGSGIGQGTWLHLASKIGFDRDDVSAKMSTAFFFRMLSMVETFFVWAFFALFSKAFVLRDSSLWW